jgi:hypothetical protein
MEFLIMVSGSVTMVSRKIPLALETDEDVRAFELSMTPAGRPILEGSLLQAGPLLRLDSSLADS